METATRETSIEAIRNVLKNLELNNWVKLSKIGLILKEEYEKEFKLSFFGCNRLLDFFKKIDAFILVEEKDPAIRYKTGLNLDSIVYPDLVQPGNLPIPIISQHIEIPELIEEKIGWTTGKILNDAIYITEKGRRVRLWSSETPDWLIAKKLLAIKGSAEHRGLDFNLTFKTMKKLVRSKKCYYTGVPFGITDDNSLSIDRVDASKGYIEGNVVACTARFNLKKSNLTKKEILSMAKKLIARDKALGRKTTSKKI